MRGHVFIVDYLTLPKHLECLFVGTSTRGRDYNISLLADMLRVKAGDYIFFYIQGTSKRKGRFFGVFEASDDAVHHITGDAATNPDLPLKLIYRKRIKPYKVYPKGVLEWEALDKLPTYSKELLWTLIYRKFRATRGNTMLFPWETERLISLIETENNGEMIKCENYSFDQDNFTIRESSVGSTCEMGTPTTVSQDETKRSETHFQAFVNGKLNLFRNTFFPDIFGHNIVWIGNEVFAGSGMQKIDLVTIEKIDETSHIYRLIELKHPKSTTGINSAPSQLEYYVKWAREDIGGHIIGGKKFNIKPILISLTKSANAIPDDVRTHVEGLNEISSSPEIWELDYSLTPNKIL